jgi:phage shock protein PspC (stress-responsive transcriptional regulator)
VLDSTRQVESALLNETVTEPRVDETQLHETVRRDGRARWFRRAAGVLLISVCIAALLGFIVSTYDDDLDWRDGLYVVGVVSLISAIPALLFYAVIGMLHDRNGNRIYKRLDGRRKVSGVCVGLSEATGMPVLTLRLIFVALLFVKGAGLWLYIVLDLAMPVHPDDRVNLMRFRIRRWFQKRFARHANADAR